MDVIRQLCMGFQHRIILHFCSTYNLRHVVLETPNLPKLNTAVKCSGVPRNYLYQYMNFIIIPCEIAQHQFNIPIPRKYSHVMLNIRYSTLKYNSKNMSVILTLDSKKNIHSVFNAFQCELLYDKVFILGRKYVSCCEKYKVNNALGMPITLDTLNQGTQRTKDRKRGVQSKTTCALKWKTTNPRRAFLYELQQALGTKASSNMLNNCLYLDTEYIIDVYDDFSKFPLSNDSSLLFMIGVAKPHPTTRQTMYTHFTCSRLTQTCEYDILSQFINLLEMSKPLVIFHWSHADVSVLKRTLCKYEDLLHRFERALEYCKFVDLMRIVKSLLSCQSYSLKYVSKALLGYQYESTCQDGLNAMFTTIKGDQELKNNLTQTNLIELDDIQDIIKYNEIDTTLLHSLVQNIMSNANANFI